MTDECIVQRPYPFTIDNRESPLDPFQCCGAPGQGEHADHCSLHFNRKTLHAHNQKAIDIFACRLAEAIDSQKQ